MKPDRQTYEAWLLDRLEGRLSPGQERALAEFLQANPDLAAEAGALPAIGPLPMTYPDKQALRKGYPPTGSPDAARLDDFLVARMEKDLSLEQERALTRYLREHPEADKAAELMALARIEASPMAYPDKEQLRKQRGGVLPLWGRLAMAASILLVIGIGVWYLARPGDEVQVVERGGPDVVAPSGNDQVDDVAPSGPGGTEVQAPATDADTGLQAERPAAEGAQQQERDLVRHMPEESPYRAAAVEKPLEPARPNSGNAMHEPGTLQPIAQAPGTPVERPGPIKGETLPAPTAKAPLDERAPAHAVAAAPQGQTLGQALANTTREHVLQSGKRKSTLDEQDLLAMADKVVGAVTPGGGVDLDRTEQGNRLRLRFGRNVSISVGLGR